jgi:hemolysin D
MPRPPTQDSQPIFPPPPLNGLEASHVDIQTLEHLDDRTSPNVYGGAASQLQTNFPGRSHGRVGRSSASQWSQPLQTLLDHPPSTLPQRMLLGGLIFSSAFVAWAWFGQISDVSHANGRLVPEGEVYKVQPVMEGEVAKILVKEGQQVRANQVIAELDTQLVATTVERLKKSLADSQLELTQTQELVAKTQLEKQTRQAIAVAQVNFQQSAIHQAADTAITQRRLLEQLQTDVVAYQTRLARIQPLIKEGAISSNHLFEIEQALRDRQRSIIQTQGDLQKSQGDAKQLQAKLAQTQAEGQQSQLETQQQLGQLDIKIAELQEKINTAAGLLKEANTRLKQSFLYAPVAGVVSSLTMRNVGEVAKPGQTVVEIAPAKAPLILSAIVPSRSAGLLKPKMPVNLKLDAFPYQDYGTISGKVSTISSDSKADEQAGAVYRVEIALDRNYVIHNQQKVFFKAGQTASAEIITRQRRIADILLDPIRKLQQDRLTL